MLLLLAGYNFLPLVVTRNYGLAIIFMFNYSEPSMILFACSNYYDLQLIITKYILAELIILFAVIFFE